MILVEKTYAFPASHGNPWRTEEILKNAIDVCFIAYIDATRPLTNRLYQAPSGNSIYINESWTSEKGGVRVRKWVALFDTEADMLALMRYHGLSHPTDELQVPYQSIGATLTIKVEEV
jgi:hypothetical protein